MAKPLINAPILDKLIPNMEDVNPFISLQSTDSLLVKVPALFLG